MCLPTDFLFGACLALPLVLPVTISLVLRRGAGETFGTHDSGDVLLAALSGFSDGLRNDPVGLFLLLLRLNLVVTVPPLRLLLRGRAGGGRGRRGG